MTIKRLKQRFVARAPMHHYIPHPMNPNEGDVGLLAQLMQNNGFHGAAVAWATAGGTLFGVEAPKGQKFILAGAHRHMALTMQGATHWPVFEVTCPAHVAQRILVADNAAAGAHDRWEVLTGLLAHMRETSEGLKGTGYTTEDLDDLVARHGAGPQWEPLPDTSTMPDELPRPDHIVLELPDAGLKTNLLVAVQALLSAHPEWKADVA